MANQITYFNKDDFRLDYDRDTLGLLLDDSKFVALDSLDFASAIASIKNFALHIDNGNCTFIKEFRKSGESIKPYWYACKRINGKIKKIYFGHEFSKDKLMQIVDRLQVAQVAQVTQVTQESRGILETLNHFARVHCAKTQDETTVATEDEIIIRNFKRIAETWEDSANLAWDKVKELEAELESVRLAAPVLAGNGKNDRHIQPSLMELANQPDKLLVHRCNELERQNKDLNNRLIDALDTIAEVQKTLDQRDSELLRTHQKLLKQDETIARQADLIKIVGDRNDGLQELHKESLERIFDLECEASKREDNVQGYAYMYEEHSNKIFAYQALIEQYRAMTTGKNKKAHPRFAYLIDFLADIDKLC
jgi:hypothetical protein